MRSAARIAAGVCAAAVLALVVVALIQRDRLGFTLGVPAALPVLELKPGHAACQRPITVPPHGEFDRIALALGTYGQAGPAMRVEVRELPSGRVLGSGDIRAGYADIAQRPEHVVVVGNVAAGRTIEACVANRGARRVAVYGNADAASRTSGALIDGAPANVDLALRFERPARSVASLLPAMADRAALFKTGWAGGWTVWLLGALVLLAVPALLVRAVRGALE